MNKYIVSRLSTIVPVAGLPLTDFWSMQNRIDNNLFWFDLFTVLAPCILTLIFYVLPGTEIHQDRAYQTAVTTLWLRWYTSLVILLNTTIPSMIIQQSADEQLTTSHKEIHQLGKTVLCCRAKLPLFVLVYMQVYTRISVKALPWKYGYLHNQ